MKQMPVSGIDDPTENVHLATGVTDRFVRPRFITPPICGPPQLVTLKNYLLQFLQQLTLSTKSENPAKR